MVKEIEQNSNATNVVFVVCCYGNIIGVFGNKQLADYAADERIMKGHPADILCRIVQNS